MGKCIYNMDHYCPWMSNCVGFYNYRYFVMFLLYLQLGCWYVMILLLVNFMRLPHNDRAFIKLSSMLQTNLFVANNLSASAYCFSLAISAAISSGVLLIWHIYLCLTNQVSNLFTLKLCYWLII